jgi:cell pole-organizing protein PopZ
MSGQTPPPVGPGTPAVASDQSMEDILASIRRILNEDEAMALPVGSAMEPAEGAPAAPGESEPLLLTEEMMVSAPVPEPVPEPAPAPEPPPAPPMPEPPAVVAEAPPAPDIDSLLAPAVAAAATASVGQLLRAVSSERGAAVTRGGPSIEDVVREELRPLLKSWLDQHLPAIVERLVRAEIERVTGRALG